MTEYLMNQDSCDAPIVDPGHVRASQHPHPSPHTVRTGPDHRLEEVMLKVLVLGSANMGSDRRCFRCNAPSSLTEVLSEYLI